MGKQTKAILNNILAVSGVVVAISGIAVMPVSAAATQSSSIANGFQISPVSTELTIDKGQSQVVDLSIYNPTNDISYDQIIVNDFIASNEENGTPRILLNGQVSDPRHNFIALVTPVPNVTIQPKSNYTIPITIKIPANANSGGYYGAIRIAPASAPSKTGNVGLTASVGSIFLITVPGNLIEKLNLVQLSAAENGSSSSLIFSGTPQVLTRLDNVGDIHVQPFGSVNVTNMFGKIVANYQFNDISPRANILPNSIRKFVDNLPKKSWWGHYTIEENIAYTSGSSNLITAKAGFWYMPIWFVIALAVVVILIVTIIYRIVLHFRHPSPRRRR
jgi:hypothetical protein